MLAAYAHSVGSTRRELHRAIEAVLANEPFCDTRRVRAFCKLLDDASEFDKDKRGEAAKLRVKVFSMAAKFHPLVTDSIDKLSYRQFNYQQLMSHSTQLARWLHKYLVSKYTMASKMKPFEMRYSTIKRDSAMLSGYKRERQAIEACDFSMDELKTQKIAHEIKREVIAGARNKIIDVVYTINPTLDFVAEVKAANARQGQLKSQ